MNSFIQLLKPLKTPAKYLLYLYIAFVLFNLIRGYITNTYITNTQSTPLKLNTSKESTKLTGDDRDFKNVKENDPIDQDDVWAAEQLEKGLVLAWVNGRVTHGDHFRIILNNSACDAGNLFFTSYTTKNNKNIFNLKGKIIELEYNQEKVKSKMRSVHKFLTGHQVTFDLGYSSLEYFVDYHKKLKNLSVKLIDTPDFKASDYFDVTVNEWSLTNFESSLVDAQSLCEKHKSDSVGKGSPEQNLGKNSTVANSSNKKSKDKEKDSLE